MGIHIPTIVLVIAISSVLNFFMLLAQYVLNREFKGVLYWLCGFAIIAFSQFILFNGGQFNNESATSLSDVLLVTGFITISAGLKIFFKFPLPGYTFLAMFCIQLVSAYALTLHKNINIEQVVLFAILGSVCLINARDLYRHHKAGKNLTAIFLMVFFILYAIVFFIEGGIDLVHIGQLQTIPTPEMVLLIYLLSFIIMTIAPFSFVMLVNHELISERQQALNELKKSETTYRNDFLFLQSILESSQDIIIFSLDANYRYTKFTYFHKAVMKKRAGVDIVPGCNMLQLIENDEIRENTKHCFDRALRGESFVCEEIYGDADGVKSYYENRYSPVKNNTGALIGLSVFVIDITERRVAENEILEAKNHFETLFKISPDAAIVTRMPDGVIIDVNDAFESGTGYQRNDAVGSSTIGLGLWHNAKDRATFLETINANGIVLNFEADFKTQDGTVSPGMVSAKAYRVNGVPHIISITHDLKERRKREEALHLVQHAISNISEAVFWVKENGRFFNANNAACRLFGLSLEELTNTTIPEIVPDFNTQRWQQHWQEMKEKKHLNFTTTQAQKDGTVIDIEVNANYINFNGIELLCSFVRDVTERKKAEAEKEKVWRDFEALISSTNDRMWSVDREYKLIAGNKAFIKEMAEQVGFFIKNGDQLLNDVYFDEAYLQYWKKLYQSVLIGKSARVELNSPGTETEMARWSEIYLNPVFNGEEVTGVACFGRDITRRKRQEKIMTELNNQVKQRADELSASNRELEQFAYVASHDLQEPLRMVSSFLKLLDKRLQGKLDEKGIQYINFAVDGANRMRQIILDLLEYSRVGKSERAAEKIDMNEMMNEIVHINSITIDEHKAEISWGNLPEINAIKLSLQQVLQNLINNALKYHQPGIKPVVTVNAKDEQNFWQIEVADNGIGINPMFFEKIFVVFQRLHTNEDYKGTGIGLSICKKIIEKQGGKIWVSSGVEKGSRFYFTIKK